MTIHIVEDDCGVRDALVELMQGLGRRVAGHPDGEAFIETGVPAPGDVVLVDLGLPGMSGEAVLRWLRALPQPPGMIAITGRPRGDIEAVLRALPGLRLLRKPLTPEALTALV